MSEELKNIEEVVKTDNTEDLTVYDMEPEESGSGLVKVLAVVGLGAVAAGAALWHKNKDKIEEIKIDKLRKKGYVVYKEDEVEVRDIKDLDEDSENDSEPKK